MDIQSVSCVFFSPTGTTKTIAENIAQGMNAPHTAMVDCTKRSQREGNPPAFRSDLAIIATPVYYGRVPVEVAAHFAALVGEGTPAVLVAVYGNRAFEDALRELHDIAVARGFIPVAGGAFVAEHSYSSPTHPIAPGRPDSSDLRKAQQLGAAVREKLRGLESLKGMAAIAIPGQVPYIAPENLAMIGKARAHVPLTPETDPALCTRCGQCVEVCPTGAISPDDMATTDRWRCLICFACVKSCPVGARQMREPLFCAAIQELHRLCQERKEPELFL